MHFNNKNNNNKNKRNKSNESVNNNRSSNNEVYRWIEVHGMETHKRKINCVKELICCHMLLRHEFILFYNYVVYDSQLTYRVVMWLTLFVYFIISCTFIYWIAHSVRLLHFRAVCVCALNCSLMTMTIIMMALVMKHATDYGWRLTADRPTDS